MNRYKLSLLATLFAATGAIAKPPAKPPVAPAVATICDECHGANGVSAKTGVPHLNGQLPDYTVESLEKFKAGKRPSTAPQHVDPGLTADAIASLARYYGAQKVQRPAQAAVDPAKVGEAAALYGRRCRKCHLDDGRDSDHDAPLMAGQTLEYLQAQTRDFVTGKRKFPFLMDEAYQGLSGDDLDRLSHYFASQQQ